MSNKKVLIADDNVHNMELLKDVLGHFKTYGMEILEATGGEQAYEMIREEKPALVLLDVQMPGMDGYEVSEKVRDNPDLKDVYIIMVTAQTDAEDRSKAAEAGVDEYITKPYDIRQVRERVQSILKLQ